MRHVAVLLLAGCGGVMVEPADATPGDGAGYNIAYVDHGQLCVLHSGDHDGSPLGPYRGFTPTFIRDGGAIATLSKEQSNVVELVSLDGGLTEVSLPQSIIAVSSRSDGARFIVASAASKCLMSYDVATAALTSTPICNAGQPLYGPDDRTLVYSQADGLGGVAIVTSTENGTERDVVFSAADNALAYPAFSFDGTQIVFVRNSGDGVATDIVVFDRGTHAARTVTTLNHRAYSPRFTPDGKSILVMVVNGLEVDSISLADGATKVVIPALDEPVSPYNGESSYWISVGPTP